MKDIVNKIRRRLLKLRLHPIRVFVIHNVSKCYSTMEGPCADWVSIEDFHRSINILQKQYTFISMEDAMHHLKYDVIRIQNYAVLTADDGYRSVYEQIPWLIEHNIPISLYINPKYLDGKSYSNHLWSFVHNANPTMTEAEFVEGRYITGKDLQTISSSLITIGSHGYVHIDNAKMNREEYLEYMNKTLSILKKYTTVIPFHAYPWGTFSRTSDEVLSEMNLCPLRADGTYNINDYTQIHREYLPIC